MEDNITRVVIDGWLAYVLVFIFIALISWVVIATVGLIAHHIVFKYFSYTKMFKNNISLHFEDYEKYNQCSFWKGSYTITHKIGWFEKTVWCYDTDYPEISYYNGIVVFEIYKTIMQLKPKLKNKIKIEQNSMSQTYVKVNNMSIKIPYASTESESNEFIKKVSGQIDSAQKNKDTKNKSHTCRSFTIK